MGSRPQPARSRAARRRTTTARAEAAMDILRTADALRRHFDTLFEPYGLTGQQYNVLRILRGARPDPLPTMEIAQRMIERTPGITRLIDKLEEKGLIERERGDQDRRCVYCSITARGLRVLEELDEPVEEADERVMRAISAGEAQQLSRLLKAIQAKNIGP